LWTSVIVIFSHCVVLYLLKQKMSSKIFFKKMVDNCCRTYYNTCIENKKER